MDKKIITIYDLLLDKLQSKDSFSDQLSVTTKTIENKIKVLDRDIKYSKRLGSYCFNKLLPSYVTLRFLSSITNDCIENIDLSKDFKAATEAIVKEDNVLIETSNLSEFAKRLIILKIAINHNIVLSFSYIGNNNIKENKIVQPNQLFYSDSKHYLFATYDNKNKKSIGEGRTFFVNSISNIENIRYETDDIFKSIIKRNAFGEYLKNKSVILIFKNSAARYIKRERIVSMNYEIIKEGLEDDSVYIKYYYTEELELISLVQKWMPNISIPEENISKRILNKITANLTEISKK